jgi:hypothetical protein
LCDVTSILRPFFLASNLKPFILAIPDVHVTAGAIVAPALLIPPSGVGIPVPGANASIVEALSLCKPNESWELVEAESPLFLQDVNRLPAISAATQIGKNLIFIISDLNICNITVTMDKKLRFAIFFKEIISYVL